MSTPAALGWLSAVPPALTLVTALVTRRVLSSLLAGVLCASLICNLQRPYASFVWAIDYVVAILAKPDNLRLVIFSVLVGGLLDLMKSSGGFDAFASALQRWRGSYGKRTLFALNWVFGSTLILESWSNVLINGAATGPLYDRLGIARVRLAYFIHTIGINVVALVLINSWGAFYLVLVNAQAVAKPLEFLVSAVPYFLYCWISLGLVVFSMATGFTIGPMRNFAATEGLVASAANTPVDTSSGPPSRTPRLRHMLLPVLCLIVTVMFGLWSTGHGNITAGDGSLSILYAVIFTLGFTAVMLRIDGVFSAADLEKKIIAGSAGFLDVGALIVLALSLGKLTQDLGTGPFVAQLLQSSLPSVVIPALVFLLSAIISFSTGTSYGTFSIMVPIALPLGAATGISQELLFGACISGGVFGDNSSPISDTTIVASAAASTPVIDHARTQLPYALIAAALATFGYLLLAL
jgi:tetracycline resistance efflux pump